MNFHFGNFCRLHNYAKLYKFIQNYTKLFKHNVIFMIYAIKILSDM